jgi:hypothetical protein
LLNRTIIGTRGNASPFLFLLLDKNLFVLAFLFNINVNGDYSVNFKGLLKTLNFKFPDLIKSVEVQSLEAFKKTIDQLNSPLCNKEKTIAEVINAIKNIADVKGMDFIKILAENL